MFELIASDSKIRFSHTIVCSFFSFFFFNIFFFWTVYNHKKIKYKDKREEIHVCLIRQRKIQAMIQTNLIETVH